MISSSMTSSRESELELFYLLYLVQITVVPFVFLEYAGEEMVELSRTLRSSPTTPYLGHPSPSF